MRAFRSIGVVFAVAVLAACGGSASDSGATESVAGDETEAVAEDEAVVEVEETGNDCIDAAAAFNAIVQGVTVNLMNPSEFDIEAHRENVRRALEVAPAAVEEEFAVVANAYLKVGELLDEIGQSGGLTTEANLQKLNELSAELEQPETQDKAERLAAYFESECAGG